jgi:hypothetical protein
MFKQLISSYYFGLFECSANQITLSVDDLPKDNLEQRLYMEEIFLHYLFLGWDRKNRANKTDYPEIHATMHTLQTLKDYVADSLYDLYGAAGQLDMLSLSEISLLELDEIKELATYTTINYNHLIPANLNLDKLDSDED